MDNQNQNFDFAVQHILKIDVRNQKYVNLKDYTIEDISNKSIHEYFCSFCKQNCLINSPFFKRFNRFFIVKQIDQECPYSVNMCDKCIEPFDTFEYRDFLFLFKNGIFGIPINFIREDSE